MDCPFCREPLRQGSPVCANCGTRVAKPKLSPSATSTPTFYSLRQSGSDVQNLETLTHCLTCDTPLRPGNPMCSACGSDVRVRQNTIAAEPRSSFTTLKHQSSHSPYTGLRKFNFSTCVVSFLLMLAVGVTFGLAVPFVIGLIFVGTLGAAFGGVMTAIVYFGLLGVIWWAIYNFLEQRQNPQS